MKSITPFLFFKGQAQEALNFYQQVFEGAVVQQSYYRDLPPNLESPPEHPRDPDQLMQATLQLPGGQQLMFADGLAHLPYVVGSNIDLSLAAESEAEVDRLAAALAQGGEVTLPAGKAFWNAYFAMVRDRYHISWMISYADPRVR